MVEIRYCKNCNTEFVAISSSPKKYCSKSCARIKFGSTIIIKCKICGKLFTQYKSQKHINNCCSIECAVKYRKQNNGYSGRKPTPKIIVKCEQCGKEISSSIKRVRRFCSISCGEKTRPTRYSNTAPERKMKSILRENNIEFIHNFRVNDITHKYKADFYLPKNNTIIEVDGKYWHNYPNLRRIDLVRNVELLKSGYRIYRFWEDEFSTPEVLNVIK